MNASQDEQVCATELVRSFTEAVQAQLEENEPNADERWSAVLKARRVLAQMAAQHESIWQREISAAGREQRPIDSGVVFKGSPLIGALTAGTSLLQRTRYFREIMKGQSPLRSEDLEPLVEFYLRERSISIAAKLCMDDKFRTLELEPKMIGVLLALIRQKFRRFVGLPIDEQFIYEVDGMEGLMGHYDTHGRGRVGHEVDISKEEYEFMALHGSIDDIQLMANFRGACGVAKAEHEGMADDVIRVLLHRHYDRLLPSLTYIFRYQNVPELIQQMPNKK